MDAALAKVAIQGSFVAVFCVKLAQFAEVRTNLVRRNGGIFPPFPGHVFAGHPSRRAQAGLANLPYEMLLARVVVELHLGRMALLLQAVHQLARLVIGILSILAAELYQEPPAPVW